MGHEEIEWEVWTGFICLRTGKGEDCNEYLGFIKYGKFLD
jgi:hypothetical protein